jgi:hypothetical protein
MKKIGLFLSLFLSLEISLYAQTYYISSTTDASLGNRPLVHNNSLTTGGDLQVGNVAASTNSYGKKTLFWHPGRKFRSNVYFPVQSK